MVDPTIKTDAEILRMIATKIPNYSPSIGQRLLSLYPLSDFRERARHLSGISAQYFRASRIISDTDPVCALLKIVQHVTDHSTSEVYVAELNETRMASYWDAEGLPWGVCHASDVPYIFNEWLLPPGNNSNAAFTLGGQYAGSFISFATTGNPATKGKETFQRWRKAEPDGAFGVDALIIGGSYGTGPASTSERRNAVSRTSLMYSNMKKLLFGQQFTGDLELRKRDVDLRAEGRVAALRSERLPERCSYLDSLGLL